MLHIARMKMLIIKQLPEADSSQAMAELNNAKSLLKDSIRLDSKKFPFDMHEHHQGI